MKREELYKHVVGTAEVCGHEMSVPAAKMIARDLASYPPELVERALEKCRLQVSGRLTMSHILQRIDDGHLGAEEAWALCPRSESETVVWTDEIAEAYDTTSSLDDQISARMTFKESYTRILSEARAERRLAKWHVSPGHDRGMRVAPVRRAYELGRLSKDEALAALSPDLPEYDAFVLSLPGAEHKALPSSDVSFLPRADSLVVVAEDIQSVINQLKGKTP